jgi:hypothetical protein
MVRTKRVSSLRGEIDFVVITIRDDALTAVRKRFSPSTPVLDGRQHYDLFKLRKVDGQVITVAVARAMDQGHSAALLATQYAIEDLDPQWTECDRGRSGVNRFRDVGPHRTSAIGSLIDFHRGDANWNLRLRGDKAELRLQGDGNRLLLTFGAVESPEAFDLLNSIDKCALLI